jgi:hypothetical protein
MNVAYRMTTTRAGNEYIVRFDDFSFPALEAPSPRGSEMAKVLEGLAAIAPNYRVSDEGEFLRLEAPHLIRAFIDSLLSSLTKDREPLPAQSQQFLSNLTTDEVLGSLAAQEWNALVGTWIGGELEVGAAYASEGEEPLPIFGGATMKFDYEFGALRRMSCDSTTTPATRDCVELQFISRPDSAAMREFLGRFLRELIPDSIASVAFQELDVVTVVTLVTRPESLIPMSLVMTKEISGTISAEGETGEVYQLDVRSQKYTYD